MEGKRRKRGGREEGKIRGRERNDEGERRERERVEGGKRKGRGGREEGESAITAGEIRHNSPILEEEKGECFTVYEADSMAYGY